MEMLESLSFFMLVLATVFLARMIRQYVDGMKKAGALLFKLPRKRFNADIIGSIFFMLIGLNDLINGDLMFGAIIFIFGAWWIARGIRPYQFHENGIFLEMEFFDWAELKSWIWDKDGKPEVVLNLAGKPSRSIRSLSGKDEVEALFQKQAGRTSEITE